MFGVFQEVILVALKQGLNKYGHWGRFELVARLPAVSALG